VFEAKFMLPWSFSEEGAAEKHMAQLQHNMWVTHLRTSVLSIITGGGKWVEIAIPMDPLYLSVLVSAEKKFWRCVQSGEPPRVNGRIAPDPGGSGGPIIRQEGSGSAIARPSAHNYLTERGDVSLNYIDTDVREIVRLVLGNILKLNYTIDPGFQGMVTIQTARPLKREELLKMFETAGAIRHGHFELSSGLHSGMYVQCALVLQYPRFAEKLGQALAALFSDIKIEAVVSPAIGGLIIGQEVARALPEPRGALGAGVPALFVERDSSGMMTLRRGFSLKPDQHVLVVEDVWTTGGSTLEAIRVVEEAGARVVAAGALMDRSGGKIDFEVEAQSLIQLPIANYEEDDCPLCRQGSVAVKPGSRFVRTAS
jgi:orotate phosphoribosyltransferase